MSKIKYAIALLALASFCSHAFAQNEQIVANNYGGFLEGTLVSTDRGMTNIQRLTTANRVLSFDMKTGKVVSSKVLDVAVFEIDKIIELNVDGQTLHLNPYHKFYSPKDDQWIMAKDLEIDGTTLLTADGSQITVSSKREILGRRNVYDITVEGNHNFFVSSKGILVHNFAIVVPVVTWVIGEGIVWVTGTALAAAAMYAAADYIMTKQDGTPRCNQAQNKIFNDATRGLSRDEKERVHRMVSGCNFNYHEIRQIAREIKSSRRGNRR